MSRAGAFAGILTLIALAAGCGSEQEPRYTAESFVVAANRHDAGITLGEPLLTDRPDVSLRSIRFQGTGAAQANTARDVHGAGTLAVMPSDEAAVTEYERCRRAGLICYRAANVSVLFSGQVVDADLTRLESALEALAAE
jgi:hypothetical protein